MKHQKKKQPVENIRHSLAHILAMAVLKKFPQAQLGIGPAIENGFYYDFKLPKPVGDADLKEFEQAMRELVAAKFNFKGEKTTPAKARALFKGQPFKLDLVKKFVKEKKQLTIYYTCPPTISYKLKAKSCFADLCRGGHVKNTSEINPDAFKLTKTAGAYWRGDEKNPQLTRIYGLAFETKKELDEYAMQREEAEKRDHRKLGQDLNLFIFREEVGPGLPLFTEKGATVLREMERFIVDEEIKRGYRHVRTPDLARVKLYEISGHYPYYKDTMYPVMRVDEDELVLRPMTCPHHFMLFSSRPRSYKDLPLKIAEMAKLYRYEKSGELTGLMRVRSFSLADSHIFCAKEQAAEEIKKVIELIDYAVGRLGFVKGKDYFYQLSLGDPKNKKKYYNSPSGWKEGEAVLRGVLKSANAPFREVKNEAAFYGPKIDIQMKNAAGKEETAFTVQYDFCLPARFKLAYINPEGKKEQPIVVHRSSIGALERTFALLIEKYAGAFPFWLAPVQMALLPINEKVKSYCLDILRALKGHNFRVELDDRNETVGRKIREAEIQKIPYLLIIGEREAAAKNVSLRERGQGDRGQITLEKFIDDIRRE